MRIEQFTIIVTDYDKAIVTTRRSGSSPARWDSTSSRTRRR
ncbi:MAG TPA: hypothetical protein VKV38_15460 [Trebonia sp.]|nr:hypothetical protein [Trebonia sp.]